MALKIQAGIIMPSIMSDKRKKKKKYGEKFLKVHISKTCAGLLG